MTEISIFKQTTDRAFEENEIPIGLSQEQFNELKLLQQSIENVPVSSFLPIRLQYLLPYVRIVTTTNSDTYHVVVTCDKITRIIRDGLEMYASPGETILIVGWDDLNVQKKWFPKSGEPFTLLTQNIDPLILAHLGAYTLTDRHTSWKYMTSNIFMKPAFVPGKSVRFRNKEHAEDEINRIIRYCEIITSSYDLWYRQFIEIMTNMVQNVSTRIVPEPLPIPYDTSDVAKSLQLNNTTDSIISLLSHNLLIWDTGRLLGVEHALFQDFVKKIKSEQLSEQTIREKKAIQIKNDAIDAKNNFICLARFNLKFNQATESQKATVLKTIQNIEKNLEKMPEHIRILLNSLRENLHISKEKLKDSYTKLLEITNWKPESPEGYYHHVCGHIMIQAYQMLKFNNISLMKIAQDYGVLDSAWYCKTCGELIAEDLSTEQNIDWETAHLSPEHDALSDTIWRTIIICLSSIIAIPTVPSQKLAKEIRQIVYPVIQNYQTKLARNRTINQEKKINTLSVIMQVYICACVMGFSIRSNYEVVIKDAIGGASKRAKVKENKSNQSQTIRKLYNILFKKNIASVRKFGQTDDYLKNLFLEAMKFGMMSQIIVVSDDELVAQEYIIDPIVSWANSHGIHEEPKKDTDYLEAYYNHTKKMSPAFTCALKYFDVCRFHSYTSIEMKKADEACLNIAEQELVTLNSNDYKYTRPYGRFSDATWNRQHTVPVLQEYERYCVDTGIPHKFWGVIWKNGEKTTKKPLEWEKRKNNYPVKEFCIHCEYELHQTFPEKTIKEMNEKIRLIRIEKDDINAFYQYYESRCPDNIFHRFKQDRNICEYCGVSVASIVEMDKTYYTKKSEEWKKQKQQLNEAKQMKLSSVMKQVEPEKKKESVVLSKYSESIEELLELVKWSKLSQNFFMNLGLMENVTIYDIEHGLANPRKQEDADYTWQSRVLENYILHVIHLIQSWGHKSPYPMDVSLLQKINIKYWEEKDARKLPLNKLIVWNIHFLSYLLNSIHKISPEASNDIVDVIRNSEASLTNVGIIEDTGSSTTARTGFTQETENYEEDDANIDDNNFGYGELDVDESLIESNIED